MNRYDLAVSHDVSISICNVIIRAHAAGDAPRTPAHLASLSQPSQALLAEGGMEAM